MPTQLNSDMFMLMEALQLLANIISITAIAALAFYLVGVTAMILGEKMQSHRRAWSSNQPASKTELSQPQQSFQKTFSEISIRL